MPSFEELKIIACENVILNTKRTDSAELNQCTSNDSLTFLHLSFQVQIEKKQTAIPVTKLKIEHIGVFAYQPSRYEWMTGPENSN